MRNSLTQKNPALAASIVRWITNSSTIRSAPSFLNQSVDYIGWSV
jgi:hypothetical protein